MCLGLMVQVCTDAVRRWVEVEVEMERGVAINDPFFAHAEDRDASSRFDLFFSF